MKEDEGLTYTCPICGEIYSGKPYVSQDDNYTNICESCSVRQSMRGMGVGEEEAERIVEIVRQAGNK